MSKWKQVAGDISFDSVGCVLAKNQPQSRCIDLVRITPWLEMDTDALFNGYGFWDVATTSIDYDDLLSSNKGIKSAMSVVGISLAEYEKLEPAYKAEILASASGYENSRSTNDFAETLPAPIDEIEFWSGKASSKDIEQINDSMRREVVTKLYDGKYSAKRLPDGQVLKLAFGDTPRTFEIFEDEAQAVRYALAVAQNTLSWSASKETDTKLQVANSDEFRILLEALRDAPDSSKLPAEAITKLQKSYARTFDLDWADKREQTAYFIDEDAKEARSLIRNLLGELVL